MRYFVPWRERRKGGKRTYAARRSHLHWVQNWIVIRGRGFVAVVDAIVRFVVGIVRIYKSFWPWRQLGLGDGW